MAETTVYGCDWCGDIVPKKSDGSARFAAHVSGQELDVGAPATDDYICASCLKAFKAVRAGRYRRA